MIGTAIALQLLFGIPLLVGVALTALDVLLILLAADSAASASSKPSSSPDHADRRLLRRRDRPGAARTAARCRRLHPAPEIVTNPAMLYIAIGILGATVMPHNLYLHSVDGADAPHRTTREGPARGRAASPPSTATVALSLALFVNAAILILAAAAFHTAGHTEVAEIQDAYRLLAAAAGRGAASTLFARGAAGLGPELDHHRDAGRPDRDGGLPPAAHAALAAAAGDARCWPSCRRSSSTWLLRRERARPQLLVLSQVVLSLQLPFAVVPLVRFTTDRSKMGELVAPRWVAVLAWAVAAVIISLNMKLLYDFATGI